MRYSVTDIYISTYVRDEVNERTAFEKVFNGDHASELGAVELLFPSRRIRHDAMYSVFPGEPEVLCGNLQLVSKGVRHATPRLPEEGKHGLPKVTWEIESRHTHVDVHHQLFVHGPY